MEHLLGQVTSLNLNMGCYHGVIEYCSFNPALFLFSLLLCLDQLQVI